MSFKKIIEMFVLKESLLAAKATNESIKYMFSFVFKNKLLKKITTKRVFRLIEKMWKVKNLSYS